MSEPTNQQDRAYEQIRTGIIYASYKPGERLAMKRLCEDLELGRTPVREALVRLQQERLVGTVPQSGTYVSLIDLHAAESARFVRETLEMEVVVEASAKLDDSGYQALDDVLREQKLAAAHHDEVAFFRSDNRFHQLIFELSGRREVWDWLDGIAVNLDRFRWLSSITEGLEWQVVLDQHYQLCDAIINRRPSEARYLASTHLHKMLVDEGAVMARFPTYFAK